MPQTVATCPNPKCGKPIFADHNDPWCHECGEHFPAEFKKQVPGLVARTAERERVTTSPSSTPSQTGLSARYTDAYLVARTLDGLGQAIKVVGIILAALIAFAGFAAASKLGGGLGFAAFLLGVVTGVPLFVLGVLVSAQGQILKATIDTAVNSSPLLSHDEIRQLLK